VNGVVAGEELMSHVLAYAADLAQNCSPTSWAQMKKQVYGDWDVDVETATTNSIQMMNASVMGADFQEGVQSFLEKRSPQFAPFSD
jgi:enoyl-CoA hydratase/carnithine racemase